MIVLVLVAGFLNLVFGMTPLRAQEIPRAPISDSLRTEIIGTARVAAAVGLGARVLQELDIRVYALRIVNRALTVLGLVFLVLILYGGFLYMTSGGSEEKVGKAKVVLLNSTIGMALIISSYAIATFVSRNLVRTIFQQMLTSVQSCATRTGPASCCEEWNAYQNRITTFRGGLCAGATSWSDCGEAVSQEYDRCAGYGNPSGDEGQALPDECGGREYRVWSECLDRVHEEAGLDTNLFD